MTNQEMAMHIQKMVDMVCEMEEGWGDVVDRLCHTAAKLVNDENLNMDDKKALSDLYQRQLLDSSIRWWQGNKDIRESFDAVYMQLGCNDLKYNKYSVGEHSFNITKLKNIKMYYKYDVGIICSVRTGADKEYREEYVQALENKGIRVFYPGRDTEQIDESGGIRICRDNEYSFRNSYEIHVIFHPESQGSLFDLGMVFSMGKPIHVVNPLERTKEKSFKNVLIDLNDKDEILFGIEFDKEIEKR